MRRLVLVACLPLGFVSAGAQEGPGDPRTFGPGEKVAGKTPAEWSVAWWQWALAIPKDKNPCTDATGANAAVGQGGSVFFLAGNGGGKSDRACKVPAGQAIFFPVINSVEYAPPGKADEKALRAAAAVPLGRLDRLEVILDGKAVPVDEKSRVVSAAFPFTGPEKDALFDDATGKQVGVSDGYWVALKPLPPGEHALRFKARLKATDKDAALEIDVSYKLTVAEK